MRHLTFEAQTLVVNETKNLVESEEEQVKELPAAERRERLEKQAKRLAGLSLTGVSACAHASYDLCLKLIVENTVSYLQPSKFACRQAELRCEKPRKELDITSSGSAGNVLVVKDKYAEVSRDINSSLALHHALHRRALAMDLVGLSTYSKVQCSIFRTYQWQDTPPSPCSRCFTPTGQRGSAWQSSLPTQFGERVLLCMTCGRS